MTALLTILTTKPIIRTHTYSDGRALRVGQLAFCDRETCHFREHWHYQTVSDTVLPLEESSWVGDYQRPLIQDPLPFEDDELELADDAYAVMAGK